ncbi:MAG TPA: CapA family protein [Spirochaetia bacterium]|nr:CapA family protein [Spirochaetia bacterium]
MRAVVLWIILCLAAPAATRGEPAKDLRLTFVGDIMTHPLIFSSGDYGELYKGVADVLKGSDLSFANLEFPVDSTKDQSGYPLFNGHRDYVRAAVEAGVKVFSTANNHAFDGREEGIFQTIRALTGIRDQAAGLLYFSGTRGNQTTPFLPETILVKGVRIGFIAVTQFLNDSDGGRFVHKVDYLDGDESDAFVSFVKEASPFYDLFIVSYHGDREYVQEPDPAKRLFFHRLVESGAQIVFSHHPHVLQEYELVNVRGSRRLIMYSMGNFISGMVLRRGDPPDPDGVLALTGDSVMLTAEVKVGAGEAGVAALQPVPVGSYRSDKGETIVAKLDDLADGKAGVPAPWVAYFAQRRIRVERFLAGRSAAAPTLQAAARPAM